MNNLKMEDIEKIIMVFANIPKRTINVPKYVAKEIYKLSSPEARLYHEYINRYPDFKVVIF